MPSPLPARDDGRVAAANLDDYARAAPLNAISAAGFGPFASAGRTGRSRLTSVRNSLQGKLQALQSCGVTATRIVLVLNASGGRMGAEQFAFHTGPCEPGELATAIERLTVIGAIQTDPDGTVRLDHQIAGALAATARSYRDPSAVTVEQLAAMCGSLGVRSGTRKHERIEALTAALGDASRHDELRGRLSAGARTLFDRIARAASTRTVTPETVGIPHHHVYSMSYYRSARAGDDTPEVAALRELVKAGLVGCSAWDHELWVWSEAWPLTGLPLIIDWSVHPMPETSAIAPAPRRVPGVVAVLDSLLATWVTDPPTVLKNGEPRLGKSEVKAAAKTLRVDAAVVDVASRLAISIGLLLRNEAGRSGRGRKQRIDMVWKCDPAMLSAWQQRSVVDRWARLVAEWCAHRPGVGMQESANRHLVLWELSALPDGVGYTDTDRFVRWFADRYGSLGHPDAAAECLADLRALGVVPGDAVSLTPVGRAVLTDPAGLANALGADSRHAIVQADLTVIAPPDLAHELVAGLEAIAELESASGAAVYRLDPDRITRAVQTGRTADDIVAFLDELSSVTVPDAVGRLVQEAAQRAGSVRLIAAPTVLVVSDPADLVTACSIKSLKMNTISDTVAWTTVPLAKVRAALDRKGLAPEAITGSVSTTARSSIEEAEAAKARARELRDAASGSMKSYMESHARSLDEHARRLGDVDGRLAVTGPLALIPERLAALTGTAS